MHAGSCCPKPDFWNKYNFTRQLVDFQMRDLEKSVFVLIRFR